MSRLSNERRMRALVARWREDGGSAAFFASRHGVSPAKFGYWRRRAERQESPVTIGFRPLHLVDGAVESRPLLEITLAGGERVLVHAGASAELLRAAVSAVRARC